MRKGTYSAEIVGAMTHYGGIGVAKRPTLIAKQSSNPSGVLGRLISNIMAMETSRENGITLDRLELRQGNRLLEVGFGHGKTIKRAASLYSGGFIAGVDVSDLMVHMASRRNRSLTKTGRVELKRGDASALPFADGSFDKAYAVHTVYFWPKPHEQFKELQRVLKEDGLFVLCFRYDEKAFEAFPENVYKFRSADEICTILQDSGFKSTRVETIQDSSRTLFWIIAHKKG